MWCVVYIVKVALRGVIKPEIKPKQNFSQLYRPKCIISEFCFSVKEIGNGRSVLRDSSVNQSNVNQHGGIRDTRRAGEEKNGEKKEKGKGKARDGMGNEGKVDNRPQRLLTDTN